MKYRISIEAKEKDAESINFEKKINSLGYNVTVNVANVYTIDYDFDNSQVIQIADSLTNDVFQIYRINKPYSGDFDYALELGFLPGVTDNVANTTIDIVNDLFGIKVGLNKIFTTKVLFIKGLSKNGMIISKEDVKLIASDLINLLIERFHIKSKEKYDSEEGMDYIIPTVKLVQEPNVLDVDLEVNEEELIKLGKKGIFDPELNEYRGPLALHIDYIYAIKKYFDKVGRKPTDIEIETLAQTWSEHCKHTIFASQLDGDIKEGIFKKYIKGATEKIRKQKGKDDFCLSVFKDNSGGIIFDENYMITDKAETHNSPSALDPFGGAITGIVGVNRDTMGFGQGALPIANKYGFCLGKPEDLDVIYRGKNKTNPVLLPRRIMDGVVHGVNVGGNCSGIPTPTGFVYFDDCYKGKPLIFVGTIGLIPRVLPDGGKGEDKKAEVGDNIVMIGGRVGKDGIHGATFSSEALSSGSPATAVQIGDPITQKKMSDAIIKEARDLGLYNSITDNGAGGLSSSVGEMAEQSGGFIVDLEKVPLKYPGLHPWEIWISESQERMSASVSDEYLNEFIELMNRRGVEATVIGKFTDSGKAIINFNGKEIFNINMDFLHNGLPDKKLKTLPYAYNDIEPKLCIENHKSFFEMILGAHNVCSHEYIARQYDHEVQGNSVIKPLQGVGRVIGGASVIRPLFDSKKGVVMSQALAPRLSEINCYDMAANAIDKAIRDAVAVGANVGHMALMDNFCWCSSDEADRLGQLKDTAKACYDYSVAYLTPLISGKDSMFNDFKGFDKEDNPIKISVLPTLMISSLSVIDDIENTCSMDFKLAGNIIYVLGDTKDECGGSEYYNAFGEIGTVAPKVDAKSARKLYQKMYFLHANKFINSCSAIGAGGLVIALAKMSIAGDLGALIDISTVNEDLEIDKVLYSESASRFVVSIHPEDIEKFKDEMKDFKVIKVGKVIDNGKFIVKKFDDVIIETTVDDIEKIYKQRFGDY